MCFRIEPTFTIRELKLDDCEEVRNIWREGLFVMAKYNNDVLLILYGKLGLTAHFLQLQP
jgi:hypothetical protein